VPNLHGVHFLAAAAREALHIVVDVSDHRSVFTMSMSSSSPPVDVLAPEGWAHSEGGEMVEGKPRSCVGHAFFRHSRELQAHDVLRTQVVEGGGAWVGFATESYDVEKHGETIKSTAGVSLSTGTTVIDSDISSDGEFHYHPDHLKGYIPKTLPYDVALRINKDGNVPQIQFNDDSVWHDFAPDRAAVKAGLCFPFLQLDGNTRLGDHCVHRPKPTKSAGKTSKAPAAASSAAAASDGAGAATGDEESDPPPQKKARHDEGGGSH
jgi:hypothetical protein